MPQPKDDLRRSLVALEQDKTLIAVVELSSATWLVGGMDPGIKREPLKKLAHDQEALLALLHRWRDEAIAAGHAITRLVVAFEAGRDGFWLARYAVEGSKRMSFIRPTFRSPGSGDARRPIGWILGCSNGLCSVGCAARRNTPAWPLFPHWKRRMRTPRAASASNWLASAPASSTGLKPPWCVSAFAVSTPN